MHIMVFKEIIIIILLQNQAMMLILTTTNYIYSLKHFYCNTVNYKTLLKSSILSYTIKSPSKMNFQF